MAYFKFTKAIAEGKPIDVYNYGRMKRDFTYIDNVIQMNLLAMTTVNKKAINQIFNTACGQRTNLNELVNILKRYLSNFDKKINIQKGMPIFFSLKPVF